MLVLPLHALDCYWLLTAPLLRSALGSQVRAYRKPARSGHASLHKTTFRNFRMPKKVYPDGKPCDEAECQGMAALWDQHAELRNRALSGQRLMQAATGDSSSVLPSMENMSHNHLVLKEIVLKMGARQRLSSDPAERLAKMFLGWYTKYAAQFQQKPNFEATAWAFKDGWVTHKMFTILRPKVMRPETPRELRLY